MKPIVKFELTKKQTGLLNELFAELHNEQGMILGQFIEADDGSGFAVVGFLPKAEALAMQRSMGIEPGVLTPETVLDVYCDME